MSLGGFGLNPFHDIAHLGNNIGSLFGNTAAPSKSFGGTPSIGDLLNADQSSKNYITKVAAPVKSIPALYPSQNTGSDSGYYDSGGNYVLSASTGGGGYYAPPVDLNAPYKDLINAALGRLPGQEAQAERQVHQTYDTNLNQLNSGHDQAQNSYGLSTDQNRQQFVTNKNQINDQASTGLRSLLRVLGQHGAGGSSAAQFAAPGAVSDLASRQRAGAGETFGQNQQTLDTNWGNYNTGFDNSKKQLSDWLGQQLQGAQSNQEQTKQSLLQQLISLQPSVAAAAPLVNQINDSANKVDSLANFNPSYTGTSPVYNAPSVASYNVQSPGAPALGQPGNNTNASTPALNFLLGLQKDKQLQPQF